MGKYEEALGAARGLPPEEQVRLVRELVTPAASPVQLGPLPPRGPAPQSVAWLKAERGHAVLATDTGPAEADIPEGAAAIRGMWSDLQEGQP